MKNVTSLVCVSLILVCMAMPAHAQRGGRGGGGGGGRSMGGGGGGRSPGGGNFGGQSMQSPSYNRSPSMSRPSSPAMNRPSPVINQGTHQANNYSRPANVGNRLPSQGNVARPNNLGANAGNLGASAGGQRPSGLSPSQMGINSAGSYQRPNQNQLGSFLNMPAAPGSQNSQRSTSSSIGASQLPSSGNSRSFTTEGGSTITVGGASGSGSTAGGANVGGAIGGIKVETPGGGTYGKVGGIAGATDGTNSAVRGGSITGANDGQGNRAVNVRGGYADSSGYRQGGSITAAQNQFGYTSAAGRAGYGYGNGTGQVGAAGAVRGPAGNVVSAGRGAGFVNGQFVGGQTWSAVNGNYNHWNYFGPGYIASYPNAWWPGKWAIATTAWATATYAVAGSYCGTAAEGTYYDYGQNVTYEEGVVYQDGAPVASAEEYYEESQKIAESGQETQNEDWMPLGVFAIVTEGQTNAEKVAQLALNKEGVIRGNLHDVVLNQVTPISGAVDKQTQRVAMKIKGNDGLVVESGLYNLTNDEVPVLLHFDAGRQETRTLVRLKQPAE